MKRLFEKLTAISLAIMVFAVSLSVLTPALNAQAATNGTCGQNLTWEFDSYTGTLTISGTGEMDKWGAEYQTFSPWNDVRDQIKKVVISEGVTSIGDWAFANYVEDPNNDLFDGDVADSLKEVVLPTTLTKIGSGAFYCCNSISQINLPHGLEYIGDNSFYFCTGLSPVTIPETVTYIGSSAFYFTSNIDEITIPGSVSTVSAGAFSQLSGLSRVTICDGVGIIDEMAFGGCYNLKSVILPSSISEIKSGAFYYNESLSDVYYAGSEEEWSRVVIGGGNESLDNAVIHFNYVIEKPEPTTTREPVNNEIQDYDSGGEESVTQNSTSFDNSVDYNRITAFALCGILALLLILIILLVIIFIKKRK
ncbi:MAG: leucine-rich repeat domain-containing protein [Clostridia bacterium]|nr:leucine-rich repeat domain-containing protein [Clostridia bacterium]